MYILTNLRMFLLIAFILHEKEDATEALEAAQMSAIEILVEERQPTQKNDIEKHGNMVVVRQSVQQTICFVTSEISPHPRHLSYTPCFF